MVAIITVDGPSGSGKGTLCARLASTLKFNVLDSGALYRILGLFAQKKGYLNQEDQVTESEQEARLVTLVQELNIVFGFDDDGKQTITVNDINVTKDIRTETVGGYASQVAPFPKVRQALLQLQRDFARAPGLIADGRDMGTTVFPEAPLKVFLTASAEQRAKRRVKQLQDMGKTANIEAILQDIKIRDERDENRSSSPSKPADDAIVLDSSTMDAHEVFKTVLDAWQNIK